MIELLGPFIIAMGPICITISANIDHFLSIPEEDLNDLEKENIHKNLYNVFRSANEESFSDPFWVESVQKYYHMVIKELQNAQTYLFSLSNSVKQIKIAFLFLGIIFILIGATYTANISFEIFKNTKEVNIITDMSLVYLTSFMALYIFINVKSYKDKKRKFIEVIKSQKLLLTSMYFRSDVNEREIN